MIKDITMTNFIRKLPELGENQEWACDGRCDHIRPKLFENIYKQSWNNDGVCIEKQSEFYYTCQHGHQLFVWDIDGNDYLDLDVKFYEEVENTYNFTLDNVNDLIGELESRITDFKHSFSAQLMPLFGSATASLIFTEKDTGSEVEISLPFLKSLKDQMELVLKSNYDNPEHMNEEDYYF